MALCLLSKCTAMRNHTVSTGLVLLLATVGGCEAGPGSAKEPPVLTVTSPARSTIRGEGGQITVIGTALPSAQGEAVDKVLVNNVQATLTPDGAFHALIDVGAGAQLIQTVARGVNGATVSDTRSIQTGQLHPVGANIGRAVAAALSADAFAKISAAAGPIIQGLDVPAMLAPLQPMVSAGGSLASLKLFVENLEFTDIKISLVPVQGGLAFSAAITKLDVPAQMKVAGALVPDGTISVRVTADKITVAGTLNVTPNGMAGFKTTLINPDVGITNSHLAGLLPDPIIDLFDLDSAIAFVASKGAELFMGPLVNQALGALGGPQHLDVLGHQLELQVAPSVVDFTPDGGVVELDMKALLAGSEASPGFIQTDNGAPGMDASHGFQLGLADDLINELLAELHALGTLNLSMPQAAGVFDTVQVKMTVPPMISADAADGEMRVVLGDMFATFTSHGTPVGKAAINARIDLKIAPLVAGGSAVGLQLGTPEIHVDTLDDIANATGLDSSDLSKATAACLGAQIDALTKLLVAIPVPSLAGLQLRDLSIGADDGYVMISGTL
ncbi:MAG TPA: hypothetical protein VK601_23725 [Kofleriaceae bacterium]|nr:hypothetical protein [Kofleriaceae bacterium]